MCRCIAEIGKACLQIDNMFSYKKMVPFNANVSYTFSDMPEPFPTHAGIFYCAFHIFWHIFILQEYFLSEFPTHAGSMVTAHLKSVGHFSVSAATT